MPSLLRKTASLVLALLVALSAAAAEPIAFSALSPAEQRVLMPFAESWSTLPETTQHNLRLGAQRWNALTPEEKRGTAQRFGDWQRLSTDEQRRVRERYQKFRNLPRDQQQRLRAARQRFKHLQPEQRAQMRRRFEGMSPGERRAFIDGMQTEHRAGAGERALQSVPPEQRAATMDMMARFTPPERQRLMAHLRNLPPAEREPFRIRLLAMSVDERIAFVATLPQ